MNKLNVTEGYWVVDDASNCVLLICNDETIIAEIHRSESDAHLIAQAKNMYKELENLLCDEMHCTEYDRIYDLLAKCRGE